MDTGHDIDGFPLYYDVAELSVMLVEALAGVLGGLTAPTEYVSGGVGTWEQYVEK